MTMPAVARTQLEREIRSRGSVLKVRCDSCRGLLPDKIYCEKCGGDGEITIGQQYPKPYVARPTLLSAIIGMALVCAALYGMVLLIAREVAR